MTDNELIAEFMGGVFYGPDDSDHPNKWWFKNQPHEGYRKDAHHLTSGLRYAIDWSWLMPVVHKIAEYRLAYPEQVNKVCEAKVVIGKQYLYEKVVEFIKWYNGNR